MRFGLWVKDNESSAVEVQESIKSKWYGRVWRKVKVKVKIRELGRV